MSVKKSSAALSRRGFLKGVAVAGGTVAVSAVASETANTGATTDADQAKQGTAGYHVTPHILQYYEKARF